MLMKKFPPKGGYHRIEIAKKTSSESILLSPACASFDQYQNYEERGNHFKNLVKSFGIIK